MRLTERPVVRQERVDAVVAALTAFRAAHGETGLTGISVDIPAGAVHFYWCRPIPAPFRRAAAHARATVVLHPAPYCARQLWSAVNQVMGTGAGPAAVQRHLLTLGVRVFGGGPAGDYTGTQFTVGIDPGRPVPATLQDAEQLIIGVTRVPCVVTVGQQAVAG